MRIYNFTSVLTKGVSAEVQITLRPSGYSGLSSTRQLIPLEPFSVNKEMGRILIRRGGETIAAGGSFILFLVPLLSCVS